MASRLKDLKLSNSTYYSNETMRLAEPFFFNFFSGLDPQLRILQSNDKVQPIAMLCSPWHIFNFAYKFATVEP